MSTDVKWTVELAAETANVWVTGLRARGGTVRPDLARATVPIAVNAAQELVEGRPAFLSFSPGNGTAYAVAVVLLPDGPAAMWGGRLLVALPETSGRACCCFGIGYELDPLTVTEHLALRPGDAVPIAVLLTTLSAALVEAGVR